MAGEPAHAFRGVEELLDVSTQRAVCRKCFQQLFTVTGGNHEHVIQVVRHSRGEFRYGLHTLRLHDLVLQKTLLAAGGYRYAYDIDACKIFDADDHFRRRLVVPAMDG